MNQISKEVFPLGIPVIVESIIDRQSGYEFDAPMEVMVPFRMFCEVHSTGHDSVEQKLEDLIIDLDCGIKRTEGPENENAEAELAEVFSRVRSGYLRDRFSYFRTEIQVDKWSSDSGDEAEFFITELK